MQRIHQGSNILLPAATLLLLLLSGCTEEETLSPVALPPSLPQSMKGYELYSWKSGRAWHSTRFTLITGTHRLKTYAEITSPESVVGDDWVKITVEGLPELKATLGRLPPGASVSWTRERGLPPIAPARFRFPPRAWVREVQSYCSDRDIQLAVAR
jgi:hypothetical protein